MEIARHIGGLLVFLGIGGCVASVVGLLMLRATAPQLVPVWAWLRRLGFVSVLVGTALLVLSVL
jgi:hypothetical protein